jgi:four helix bundle protein
MALLKLEELRVYAAAERLADLVWDVVLPWDRFARDTVGGQLVRAADSVGANIAEGFGRASAADNQRFVRIARGSLYEARHFLRRADRRKLLSAESRKALHVTLDELLPLLNAYLASLGPKPRSEKQNV